VLGASSNLRDGGRAIKGSENAMAAICAFFFYQHFHSVLSNMLKRLWKARPGIQPHRRPVRLEGEIVVGRRAST
jgi:hypothetical protein